uniref:NADH dehydrogenase subunit 5 n=1 Tax=Harpegnathos venator TaxID=610381 RepID=UPI002A7EFAAF|nr:NADH dehydrogenase subunit 5 [Harpegnathos venator]WON66591.1 NADH dehydrogenase subunit 5 [Harpegnathos venator]
MYMSMYSMMMVFFFFFFFSVNFFLWEKSLVFEWGLMSINSMNMELMVYVDWISLLFISIVLLISLMVLIYSMVYMSEDNNIERYFILVMLFVMSMILMIMSPNLISILYGWDGLGLVSYCLVIYYQNYSSFNSGMVTVLMNRVGDIMILMGIGMMMMYGSWNNIMMGNYKKLILMILIAGLTKSAQIPFSSWLPMAMAAPTPVSALVHSSTLVTAGVYLLIRFNKFLMMNKMMMGMLMLISVLTMFLSGLMASFEYDMKKIIALSTLSQLGLMMMILSMGLSLLSYFHLMTHAIFKSLLFMSAGVIIHLMNNNQDIRLLGGLNEFIPFTMMSFHLTLFSLCGFPFMSGFYSKDLIMEVLYFENFNWMMMFMAIISLSFTVMYSVRLSYYIFFGKMKISNSYFMICESKEMNISMVLLMILSVIIGSLLNWLFFFDNSIFLSVSLKMVTLMMLLLGLMLVVGFSLIEMMKLYYLSYFFSSMWFLNYVYIYMNKYVMIYFYSMYYYDKCWMEYMSKMLFINMFKEFMNSFMNYKYKMYLVLNLVICWVFFSSWL